MRLEDKFPLKEGKIGVSSPGVYYVYAQVGQGLLRICSGGSGANAYTVHICSGGSVATTVRTYILRWVRGI